MAWIAMRTDLDRDPAVIRMAEKYGWPEHCIVGLLFRVWSWADGQLYDGNAPGVTKAFLNRYTGVTDFAESMIEVGWLVETTDGIAFPKWENWMGESAKKRLRTHKRVQKHRKTGDSDCNAASVTKALPEKRREEKRREQVKKPPKSPKGDVGEVVAFWNSLPGVRGCRKLSDKRRRALTVRLNDPEWLADLKACREKFPLKCFSDGGWKPDIEWIARPDSVTAILEGKYDFERESMNGTPVNGQRQKSLVETYRDYKNGR